MNLKQRLINTFMGLATLCAAALAIAILGVLCHAVVKVFLSGWRAL